MPTKGMALDEYTSVRNLFEANLSSGLDLGASFSATVEGETVIDLWGGWADAERTRAWNEDTIVNLYSTTKTMTALCALILIDRGELDVDAPVARYWPEFAVNGKAQLKVRHLMSHTAGLPSWPSGITLEDLYDWDKITGMLAQQMPLWTPGTAWGYHANTQGFLIGEVVRRITGRTLGTFFREEVAEPLGADFHFTLPASEDTRVADLIAPGNPPRRAFEPTEFAMRLFADPAANPAHTRTRAWRSAEMPAVAGFGNARAVTLVHSLLANGGIMNGKRILSEQGCRRALAIEFEGREIIGGAHTRHGLGFYLMSGHHVIPGPNIIYGGGFGGSLVVIDFDTRAVCSYVMNKMIAGPHLRGMALTMAFWNVLANRSAVCG
jgi:CubicO group peptidase (beta-lactamase class C family)